jgi:PAS domain S-box-containing protein
VRTDPTNTAAAEIPRGQYRHLANLLEHLKVGVLMVDAKSGSTLLANQRARQLLGAGIGAGAQNDSAAAVFPVYQAGTGTVYPQKQTPIVKALKGKSHFIDDMLVVRPDGSEVLLEVWGSPVKDAAGKVVAGLASYSDITKYRETELRHRRLQRDYQTLFREMLDGFALHQMILDEQGKPVDYRFLAVNPSFERMTGLKGKDILGKRVKQVLPEIEQAWIDNYGHVALTGEPMFFENYSKELERHFEVTAFKPAHEQFACIFSDITDRKNAQLKLARLNAELEAKNAELEQVVYVASHDLRSPLVNIDGYSREMTYAISRLSDVLAGLSGGAVPPAIETIMQKDIMEALRYIRSSAARMDSLLSGLLKLSRTGRAVLNIEQLDMNQLVARVLDSIGFRIRELGVGIEVADLPPCRGDAVQLGQVFSNLLENAIKYLDPEREGIIRIHGVRKNGHSVYCVEDNGLGIEPAHQQKIFEIFHQLVPEDSPGDGLGLTIVRRILGRLGGEIRVESTPGRGSKFFVDLPFDEDIKGNF